MLKYLTFSGKIDACEAEIYPIISTTFLVYIFPLVLFSHVIETTGSSERKWQKSHTNA